MNIAFRNVSRGRPIVLTRHQVEKLSREVGRDVTADLICLAPAPNSAKTLGQLMRSLAATLKGQP